MKKAKRLTTEEKVQGYEACNKIFLGLLIEMRELSKKKPDATLSKGKVKILNRVLDDVKKVLNNEPELKYLDSLDDEDLPQNSDAVLIMVQYESALASFRKRYYRPSTAGIGKDGWLTE